jgi:hypothetical protein
MDEVVERQPSGSSSLPLDTTSAPTPTAFASSSVADTQKFSYDALEARSHLLRQTHAAKDQEGKRTGAIYDRHLTAYQTWWDADQANYIVQNPSFEAIPSLPITVAKVTFLLNYETSRPQVSLF